MIAESQNLITMLGMTNAFVLGVDLDGVCGDYEAQFRLTVADRLGVDPTLIPEQTDWDFVTSGWGIRDGEQFKRLHREAVLEDRMFLRMPAVPGVSEALWELSDAGIHIRIITHRLCINFGHSVAASDTAVWLDHRKIPYRDLCFVADKTATAADLYVDDSPKVATALLGAGKNLLVFDRAYNRHIDAPRVASWADVVPQVLKLAKLKQEQYTV
jgi:5'-nucleotidase